MNAPVAATLLQPKDFKSDYKPVWCPGCGDYSVLTGITKALAMLEQAADEGMFVAIAKGEFAGVKRSETGGKGLAGVVDREEGYFNPVLDILEADTGVVLPDGRRVAKAEVNK